MTVVSRGEVWMVDFGQTRGHEQAGQRPALIVSVDPFNQSAAELVIVVPITSRAKGIRTHVGLNPPEGGLKVLSFAKCEDVRSVSHDRLHKRMGSVSSASMAKVEYCLRVLMAL